MLAYIPYMDPMGIIYIYLIYRDYNYIIYIYIYNIYIIYIDGKCYLHMHGSLQI